MTVTIHHGDCTDVIRTLADASVDACVSDPPYALVSIGKRFGKNGAAACQDGADGRYKRLSGGFMGKTWDNGAVAFSPEFWAEVLRVLKPGGHALVFGSSRTHHRLFCAVEDAGFEIRDTVLWLFGSGFPKSHDVSKGIDKAAGYERPRIPGGCGSAVTITTSGLVPGEAISGEAIKWNGWGTALKPAAEFICLARKPLAGTVAKNVLEYGTGALNVDASRIGYASDADKAAAAAAQRLCQDDDGRERSAYRINSGPELTESLAAWNDKATKGRWPANIIHDGSDEVLRAFPESDGQLGAVGPEHGARPAINCYGDYGPRPQTPVRGDTGSAARFFYSAKADAGDRLESKHPTVKPVNLMAYLCRMITPPGGMVLDPFAGSGTTGMACMREGFNAILIEREAEYVADIKRRIAHVHGTDAPLFSLNTQKLVGVG